MAKAQWEMTAEEQRALRAQLYELREVINCIADNFERRVGLPAEDVEIVRLMSAGCRQGMAERAEKAMQQLKLAFAAARPKLQLVRGGKLKT
jgi:hypothetical protein